MRNEFIVPLDTCTSASIWPLSRLMRWPRSSDAVLPQQAVGLFVRPGAAHQDHRLTKPIEDKQILASDDPIRFFLGWSRIFASLIIVGTGRGDKLQNQSEWNVDEELDIAKGLN